MKSHENRKPSWKKIIKSQENRKWPRASYSFPLKKYEFLFLQTNLWSFRTHTWAKN